MNECGYLYIAGGNPQYVREAMISVKSLRAVDPEAHVTLITDREVERGLFDEIVHRPADLTRRREGLSYKARHVYDGSPYQKTIFVDTDTYFYEGCRPLFKLLDYFDLCMTQDAADMHAPQIDGDFLTGYTPYNTGVIAFRKNARNEILFKQWWEIYDKKLRAGHVDLTKETDQTSFMQALLHSESRVYVLSNLWNARTRTYTALKGTVKIVHARHREYESLRRKLHVTTDARCWIPRRKRCIYGKGRLVRLSDCFKKIRGKLGAWLGTNYERRKRFGY